MLQMASSRSSSKMAEKNSKWPIYRVFRILHQQLDLVGAITFFMYPVQICYAC